MRRITRKQLKQDEFMTTFTRLARFIQENSKEIIALGVIILIGMLIFVGYSVYRVQKVKKQSEIAAQILKLSSQLNRDPEYVKKMSELSSSEGISRSAHIFLTSFYIEKGEIEKAEKQLENISSRPKDIFYYQAQNLRAEIYFLQGKYDEALKILKEIEEENPADYILDPVLYKIAQCYEKLGQKNEALVYYQRLQDEFPQSSYAFESSKKVRTSEK
ncbi:MAG: tol-pal system YbgF family protein [Candidatus Aminicenantia bacterium]